MATDSDKAEGRAKSDNCVRQCEAQPNGTGNPGLVAVRPTNPDYALGLFVRLAAGNHTLRKQDFASFSASLLGSVERDEYIFLLKDRRIAGAAAWMRTATSEADFWLAGEGDPAPETDADAEAVVINYWFAVNAAANRELAIRMRALTKGATQAYGKRPDLQGNVRRVRVPLV